MDKWEHASDFVELALSIDQHFPGYVDAYYGPPEIPQAIERRGKIPLEELERIASGLADSIANDNTLASARREYLQGEVGAMQTTLRLLQGDSPRFLKEVQSLYGLTPSWTDEAAFEGAHKVLDDLIPGSGPLIERLQAFRNHFQVPVERATPVINRLRVELQTRTHQRFSLPAGESCTFEFVSDKPWNAYNWYLGNYRSRIDFNQDMPMRVFALPHLIAHEAYPGHHTEHSIKEDKLYREDGLLEFAILLSNTPAAVISEGIAQCALEVIFSPEELVALYQQILEETGLTGYSGQLLYEFLHIATTPLAKVSNNQLFLLHENGASDDEVIAYGTRYGLIREEEGKKYIRFKKDPLWRSYGFNYTLGYDLISSLLATAADRDQAFADLLSEPVTPAQVREMASSRK